MVQKRATKALNKLCVREILSLSFVCGAYFFEFRGRNPVCFVIAYNFNGKYAPEAGKTRMRTAFFTRAEICMILQKMCMMCMILSPNCCAVTIFEYSTTEVTLLSCLSVPSEHVALQSK